LRRRDRFVIRDTSSYTNVITNDPLFKITYGDPMLQYYLQLAVEDVASKAASTMKVTLRVRHGTLSLVNVPTSVHFIYGSGLMDDRIEFSGSLQDVNYALSGLHYRPDFNWNRLSGGYEAAKRGIPSVEVISIEVENVYGLLSTSQLEVDVSPVNDPQK